MEDQLRPTLEAFAGRKPAENGGSPEVMFVLGLPGSGKGTLCTRLSAEFGWYHFSVGDYLRKMCSAYNVRDAVFAGMPLQEVKSALQRRDLLPAEVIASIVAQKITKQQSEHGDQQFLIDGFPRNLKSAEAFDETIGRPKAVLLFDCAKQVAKDRFLFRGRGDDNADFFEKRWQDHEKYNRDIVKRYGDIVETVRPVMSYINVVDD